MRLINTRTRQLEEHLNPGPYAILSHTWRDNEEILYAEYTGTIPCHKTGGHQKVDYLCKQALIDGFDYAWIDTCCIDKSSSAELSEAINSMYAWYKEAQVCYIYLDDVRQLSDMQSCRWLSRGWTLQELIAPSDVRFYGIDWSFLGTKSSLLAKLVEWTNIDQIVLEERSTVSSISAATRMSWAASRKTTRVEDMAYCLLGIFGINMSLIYGEGQQAFARLQEEILRQTQDYSLLAFDRSGLTFGQDFLFSHSPEIFSLTPKIINHGQGNCVVTSEGVWLDTKLVPGENDWSCYAALACRFEFNLVGIIALSLVRLPRRAASEQSFIMTSTCLSIIKPDQLTNIPFQRILILKKSWYSHSEMYLGVHRYICKLNADALIAHGYDIVYTRPEAGLRSWDSEQLCSEINTHSTDPIVRRFAFVHRKHCEAFIVSLAVVPCGDFVSDIYVNARSKPGNVDCDTWLTEEEVHSVLRTSDDRYKLLAGRKQPCQTIAGALWVCISRGPDHRLIGLHPYDSIHLLSNTCVSNIALSARVAVGGKVLLTLVPDDHCRSTNAEER